MNDTVKDEWLQWENHPITAVIKRELKERVTFFTEQLIEAAGKDPIRDAEISGIIKGYRDFLNATYEDMEGK